MELRQRIYNAVSEELSWGLAVVPNGVKKAEFTHSEIEFAVELFEHSFKFQDFVKLNDYIEKLTAASRYNSRLRKKLKFLVLEEVRNAVNIIGKDSQILDGLDASTVSVIGMLEEERYGDLDYLIDSLDEICRTHNLEF